MQPTKYMLSIQRRFWITHRKIDRWANGKTLFFILAMGRSGTQFFSKLLDRIPEAHVVHEPAVEDFTAYQEAFHSTEEAERYIQTFRKREIYMRVRKFDGEVYGEVNSTLRRHDAALKSAFPNALFFHLVRDGRDVVRSLMSRKTLTEEDRNTRFIHPRPEDPTRKQWDKMDRFERVCWYWKIENEHLRKSIKTTLKFESLIKDYEYFCTNLLKPLNLKLPIEIWKSTVQKPENVSKKYAISSWEDWTSQQKDAFNRICGEEMKHYGYGS